MKTQIAIMALGLIAAAPAYAEVMRDTGGVTTTGAGRGIIMNNEGRGITIGNSAVNSGGNTGVRGLNNGNSDVIRVNPSVSLDGATGTNAVNRGQGGVKAGVGNPIQADSVNGTNAVNGSAAFGVSGSGR